MKSTLEKVVQSIRFWANVRHRKKQINPEIRELLEDFHKKKRNVTKHSSNNANYINTRYILKFSLFKIKIRWCNIFFLLI